MRNKRYRIVDMRIELGGVIVRKREEGTLTGFKMSRYPGVSRASLERVKRLGHGYTPMHETMTKHRERERAAGLRPVVDYLRAVS